MFGSSSSKLGQSENQDPGIGKENLNGFLSVAGGPSGDKEPSVTVILFGILVAILLLYLLDQLLKKIYRIAYRNALFSELTGKLFQFTKGK